MIRKSKYHAQKIVIDGIKFDSKKESKRYLELKLMEKAGVIKDLQLQVSFMICPKIPTETKGAYYRADFVYVENEKKVIEDVKGFKTPEYILKRKLVKWQYPEYEFREV